MNNYYFKASLLMVSTFVCLASACFITNCPVGGKRDAANTKLKAMRQCSVCGPRGVGRCYGPQICCGPQMGCHIDSRDTFVCQLESAYPVPCENMGTSSCGDTFDGRCAADGVCCSTGQCILDESCKSERGIGIGLQRSRQYPNLDTTDFTLFKKGVLQSSLSGPSTSIE